MKIITIGDPHGSLEKVKKIPLDRIELILLTGDLGSANLMRKMAFDNIDRKRQGLAEIKYTPKQEKKAFMEAYDSTVKIIDYLSKFAPVYTIYGNVESRNPETRKQSKKIGIKLPFLTNKLNSYKNVRVINNIFSNFKGLKIGGLDYFIDGIWVKTFKPSDYQKRLRSAKKQTLKAKNILNNFAKKDIDILVCHQPPFGVLDKVTSKFAPKHYQGKNAGSKIILEFIKKHQPKYVFCGHIHEGEGFKKLGKTQVYNLGVGGYKIIEI